jgi:integrase
MENIFKVSDKLTLSSKNMASILFAIPALLRFLYSTGVRISEALSIKNEDVDFGRQRIVLKKTKNQMQRLVPIHPSLLEVLRQYKEYRDKMPIQGVSAPSSFLFVSPIGKTFDQSTVYAWFKRILMECEIPHLGKRQGPHVHNIRHTAAVHSLIKQVGDGIDIYCALPILSVFLGHKTITGTEKYVRLTQEMYPEVINMEQSITSFVFPNNPKIEIDYDND